MDSVVLVFWLRKEDRVESGTSSKRSVGVNGSNVSV